MMSLNAVSEPKCIRPLSWLAEGDISFSRL